MKSIILVILVFSTLGSGLSAQERRSDLTVKFTGSYILTIGPDYSTVDKFTIPVLFGGMREITSINTAVNYKLIQNRYLGLELGYERSNKWNISREDLFDGTRISSFNISPYMSFQRSLSRDFSYRGFLYFDLGLNLMLSTIHLTNLIEVNQLLIGENNSRNEYLVSPGTFIQGGIVYLINQDIGIVLETRLITNVISSSITNEKVILRSDVRFGFVFEMLKNKNIY